MQPAVLMPKDMQMKGLLTNWLFYFGVCESPSSICNARNDAMKIPQLVSKKL
jgi:hypothetical protein